MCIVCVCVCVGHMRAQGNHCGRPRQHCQDKSLDKAVASNTHRNGQCTLKAGWLLANNTGQQSATARDFSSPRGVRSESGNASRFVCSRSAKRIGEMEKGKMRVGREELCCSAPDVTQNPSITQNMLLVHTFPIIIPTLGTGLQCW